MTKLTNAQILFNEGLLNTTPKIQLLPILEDKFGDILINFMTPNDNIVGAYYKEDPDFFVLFKLSSSHILNVEIEHKDGNRTSRDFLFNYFYEVSDFLLDTIKEWR